MSILEKLKSIPSLLKRQKNIMKKRVQNLLAFFLLAQLGLVHGKTWLRADGQTDTYKLINTTLGGNAVEVPDCRHPSYGPHITQRVDTTLNRPVFIFHIHVTPDDDVCTNSERQRVEIKTYGPSPRELKGYEGETVTFSWNFRLNSQFQASNTFCHIHQIKGSGGSNVGSPIITITPRKRSSGQILEVIHIDRNGNTIRLKTDNDLSKFTGKWIHAKEELTYGRSGKYSLVLSRLDNGQELMSVTINNLDLWRNGAEFVRPKWGIYRSLKGDLNDLRDEHVNFDSFCLGKGTSDKCT